MPQLIVRARERGQPDKQARILWAEANPLFDKRDRLLRMATVKVHLAEENVGGGIAGVETNRTAGELISLEIVEAGVIYPPQVRRVAKCDGQLRNRLWILCVQR